MKPKKFKKNFWESKVMFHDQIIEEVRKIREDHAAKFKYNIKAIYQDLKRQEKEGGRVIVSLQPKRLPVSSPHKDADDTRRESFR
ncbi:MAG: hypothetical protein ACMUIA_02520 [bacterium]